MKVVTFLTENALMEAMRTSKAAVVDRIIDHLKLTFVAAKPPPCLRCPPRVGQFSDWLKMHSGPADRGHCNFF